MRGSWDYICLAKACLRGPGGSPGPVVDCKLLNKESSGGLETIRIRARAEIQPRSSTSRDAAGDGQEPQARARLSKNRRDRPRHRIPAEPSRLSTRTTPLSSLCQIARHLNHVRTQGSVESHRRRHQVPEI